MASCRSSSKVSQRAIIDSLAERVDSVVSRDIAELDSSVMIMDFEGRVQIDRIEYDPGRIDSTTNKPVIKSETKILIDFSKRDSTGNNIKKIDKTVVDVEVDREKKVDIKEDESIEKEESSTPKYVFYSLVVVFLIMLVLLFLKFCKK